MADRESETSKVEKALLLGSTWALWLLAFVIAIKVAWVGWLISDGMLRLSLWEWLLLPFAATYQHLFACVLIGGVYFVLFLPGTRWRPAFFAGQLLIAATQATVVFYHMVSFRVGLVLGTPPTFGLLRAGAQGGVLGSSMVSEEHIIYTIVGSGIAVAALVIPFIVGAPSRRWIKRRGSTIVAAVGVCAAVGFGTSWLLRSELAHADTDPGVFFFSELIKQHAEEDLEDVEAPESFALDLIYGTDDDASYRSLFQNLEAWRQTNQNVVLVVLESVQARQASYMGPVVVDGQERDTTPRLASMRDHMLALPNHYSVHPTSMDSLFSIGCSIYPYPLRPVITDINPTIACDSISEVLTARGYVAGLFHSGHFSFWNKDLFFGGRGFSVMHDADTMPNSEGAYRYSWGVDERASVAAINEFIREHQDRPFFVEFIPVFPHAPYQVPEERMEVFPPDTSLNRYHNSLRYVDGAIGGIFETLEDLSLLDDTLVIVVGDHGEAFREHPLNRVHSGFIYEENVHVPMAFFNPLLFAGAPQAERVTSHVDILPTLADLLDIPPGHHWQGQSLLDDGPSRLVYFYSVSGRQLVGLRDGQYKVIWNRGTGALEIFDLESDPGERHNLAGRHRDRTNHYREVLSQWRRFHLALVPRLGREQIAEQGVVPLGSLSPLRAAQPHMFDLQQDRNVEGEGLTIAGIFYETGIGTHANSLYTFDISDLGVSRFSGRVGRDSGARDGVAYGAIFLDGRLAFATGRMEKATPSHSFDLDLRGVRELSVVTHKGADTRSGDQVNWTNTKLIEPAAAAKRTGSSTVWLDELQPSGSSTGGRNAKKVARLPELVRNSMPAKDHGIVMPSAGWLTFDLATVNAAYVKGEIFALEPDRHDSGWVALYFGASLAFRKELDLFEGNRTVVDIGVPHGARYLKLHTGGWTEPSTKAVLTRLQIKTGGHQRPIVSAPIPFWPLAFVPPQSPTPSADFFGFGEPDDSVEVMPLSSLWLRAGAEVRYHLKGLEARVLVGDVEVRGGRSCTVEAIGDDQPLLSQKISPADRPRPIRVDVSHTTQLVLRTKGPGCVALWNDCFLRSSLVNHD